MKKILALILALVLAFGLVACAPNASESGQTNTDTPEYNGVPTIGTSGWDGTLPLVQPGEDNVITIGIRTNANVLDFETNKYTLWLEEQTGLDLQFVMFGANSKDATTQVSLMVAGGEELPDILVDFGGINKATAKEYGQDGYFVNVAPYLATDSHYFMESMELYYPEEEARNEFIQFVLDTMTDPKDGAIYMYPTTYQNASDLNLSHIFINQDWLDTLGLTAPTTIDELYDVLVAFRDGDPNGNGIKDEIPMIGRADATFYAITQWVTNAFIYEYDQFKFNVENDVVYAPYDQPEYREALIFLDKLVDEGLLSPMTWTASAEEIKALINTDDDLTVGLMAAPGDSVFQEGYDGIYSYVPIAPLADYTGRGGWGPVSCDRMIYSTFITADCDNPRLAFRLLDFMSSPESYLRQSRGEYGVDWKFTDETNTLPGRLGGEARIEVLNMQVYSEVNNQCWHIQRSCCSEVYWQYAMDINDGSFLSTQNRNIQTIYDMYMNAPHPEQNLWVVNRSDEVDADWASANTDIMSYVRHSRANFCNGVMDPNSDADWQTYIDGLEALGYTDLWIAVAQESWNNSKK